MVKQTRPVSFYTLSHRGLVRQNNEDCALAIALDSPDADPALLAILADGVGGHSAGEIASRIAVDTIAAFVREHHPSPDPHVLLNDAIQAANRAILADVSEHPESAGMGTTCACVLIIGNTLYAAHLGDSRIYLQRSRILQRLTRDHTLFEEYQHLTPESTDRVGRNHPMAHVLSRYLGSAHPMHVDPHIIGFENESDTLALQSGDALLLCSDGISDLITDEEIEGILSACCGRKSVQMLVYRALENGGHDNATAIVLNVP